MLGRYPVEVFPPTDFHTSTFYTDPKTGKEFIFIIGGLGYSGQASRNRTDVYQLDLSDFSIHRQKTSGAGPAGGMSRHKAELLDEHGQPVIRITAEEVKEYVVKEERKESTATEEGEAPMATGKIQVPVSTEENEGSSTTTQEGKELVTIEESKMFTLRIGDMRWI